ncbi:MAG: hypothetical protein ACFB4J_10375 [Elainellaceae cyanobacterium]
MVLGPIASSSGSVPQASTGSADSIEKAIAQEASPDTGLSETDTPQTGAAMTLGVMVLTALLVVMGRSLLKTKQKPVVVGHRRKRLPCETCRFKGDSVHLRCAVHPYKAMTAEAMDCPDYWAKDSDRFERSRR